MEIGLKRHLLLDFVISTANKILVYLTVTGS